MSGVTFIGDEVSAAGYRLAGVDVFSPSPAEAADVFAAACGRAGLVLVASATASNIPAAQLDDALSRGAPLVMVVGDVRERAAPPDLEGYVRDILGLEL